MDWAPENGINYRISYFTATSTEDLIVSGASMSRTGEGGPRFRIQATAAVRSFLETLTPEFWIALEPDACWSTLNDANRCDAFPDLTASDPLITIGFLHDELPQGSPAAIFYAEATDVIRLAFETGVPASPFDEGLVESGEWPLVE
ncbi:MAG: hypothetical protein AAGF12_05995 [Myxococcota bacterium]